MAVKQSFEQIVNRMPEGIKLVKYGGNTNSRESVFQCEHNHEWQTSVSKIIHKGTRCPYCTGRAKKTTSQISDALNSRGFTLISYGGRTTYPSVIMCRHNHTWIAAVDKILGAEQTGCPYCAGNRPLTFEDVSNTVSDKGFTLLSYGGGMLSCDSVFMCSAGHVWSTSANNVVNNARGCTQCSNHGISLCEKSLVEYVKSLKTDVVTNARDVIPPKELDIYVPSCGVAIELNGVYWHSDNRKTRNYHYDKMTACAEKNIRLINITDSEWINQRAQCERIISSALGIRNEPPVNARQCEVVSITRSECAEFLNKYHIQGFSTASQVIVALRHKNSIVAVMTFAKGANRRGSAASRRPWNLTRYATSCNVRGGAGKLFKYAVTRYDMNVVESYSANDMFAGGMYQALGFTKKHDVKPDYRVYHPKLGLAPKSHWQRKNIPTRLRDLSINDVFIPDSDPRTEWQMEDEMGALRIWDSGKKLWVWTK